MIKVRFNPVLRVIVGRLCLLAMVLISLQSCTEETVSEVDFSIEIEESSKNAGLIKWSEGFAHVNGVNFSGTQGGAASSSYSPTSKVIGLNGEGNSFGRIFITAGEYSDVTVKFEFQRAGTGEQGIFLKGDYRGTVVELHVNELISAKVKAVSVDFLQDEGKTGFVMLNVNDLFKSVKETDLDNATRVNEKIIITKTPNLAIYNKVLAELENAMSIEFR